MLKIISILLIKTWSPASGLVRQTPVYFGQYWDIEGDINNILGILLQHSLDTHRQQTEQGWDLISMSLCHVHFRGCQKINI